MESYSIVINDPAHVAGITSARKAYNAALPEPAEGETKPVIETNEAYVQFVMGRAAESYAAQYALNTI